MYSGLEDPAAARAALDEAQARAAGATPRECRRIDVRRKQLDAIEDAASAEKHLAYKKAIDEALAADMDDPELWLLRGAPGSMTSGRGQREKRPRSPSPAGARVVPSFSRPPPHPLHENICRIDAVRHGEAYARLRRPSRRAPHQPRPGRRAWAGSDEPSPRATGLRWEAYYASERPGGIDWHHPHNLDLLAGATARAR